VSETTDAPTYDLVLLGATGFTGRLTARNLAHRTAGTSLRWAIAGRDRTRLEAVRAELGGDVGVEVVDVHDLVGLLDLTQRTRVLATTVGPYARHGELVAQACARSGTHYADITGEPAFVELIRSRYHDEAARNGARLVSCCGFDSVPHDLGVRWTVDQLPEGVPVRIRGYVHGSMRPSGGTATSALEAIASRDTSGLRPRTHEDGGRRTGPLPARIHRVAELDAYGVPLPTIDPAVVLHSARLLERYGPDFRYGHYAQVHSPWMVGAGVAGVAAFAAMASLPPTRALLRRVLPSAGEGPSPQQRAESHFTVTFLARAGDTRLTTRVSGGDPGYDETATMLAEAALSLAEDPAPAEAGVLPPAVALGEPYRRRLEDAGIRFEVLAGRGAR
jgi:short subunit dehydrogenase-like uncharacterized protein